MYFKATFWMRRTSVVDRHRVDADPDPNFHVDADPDPDPDWHQNDADLHGVPTPSFAQKVTKQ
jgi:hypothetical protein